MLPFKTLILRRKTNSLKRQMRIAYILNDLCRLFKITNFLDVFSPTLELFHEFVVIFLKVQHPMIFFVFIDICRRMDYLVNFFPLNHLILN